MENLKEKLFFWKKLPEEAVLSKKEYMLIGAVIALAGIVVGMMISPRKTQLFGCYNGTTIADSEEETQDQDNE